MQQSCTDCPNYLDAEAAFEWIGQRATDAPVCKAYSRMLAKPTHVQSVMDQIAVKFADGCPDFGKDVGATSPWEFGSFTVTTGDPVKNAITDGTPCKSCRDCQNYIPPPVVKEELGWSQGICGAYGRLLFPHRLAYEARDCEHAVHGQNRDTTAGLHEIPVYAASLGHGVLVNNPLPEAKPGQFIEPTQYQTDKPVHEVDALAGIRAWREVQNPKGTGQFTHLPIFDQSFFTEDERAKIPQTGDDEHPEWYVDHDGLVYKLAFIWRGLDETPVLWGEPGVGKTELLRHMAWLMQLPFNRISITESTELDDLAGKMMYTPDKGTFWVDGRIPKCWESPCVLDLDEPNCGPHDVWEFIRPMTDNAKQLVINDVIRTRGSFVFIGMAMNPAWNPTNVGTKELGAADGSRLSHIWVDRLPEHLERQVIVQRCQTNNPPYDPPADIVDRVMGIGKVLRDMADNGDLPINWNLREQMKVLRLTQYLDLMEAYGVAVANSLEPDTRDLVLDQVKSYV